MRPTKALEGLDREELINTVHRLLAEADALSSRISALNEIGLAVNQSLDLERIERVIAKQAKWLLDFDHCSVCLSKHDSWYVNTLFGTDEDPIVDLTTMVNLDTVINTTRPLLLNHGSPSEFLSDYQSQMIIPLWAENQFFGTINFAAKASDNYNYNDLRIGYMLSLQLSSALRNANVVMELRATREKLKMRVEELDAYSHTIAHDLKSPLASILMATQLVVLQYEDDLPCEVTEKLAQIEEGGLMMNRMIEQLLFLAKLRHEDQVVERVDVGQSAQFAVKRFLHQIKDRPINLTIENLPYAFGQSQWIEEVFANLIGNAIKYIGTDNPNPCITVRGTSNDHLVTYEVIDNGIGIRPEQQARLFDMFARVHDEDGVEGMGLGLSIVSRIVKRLCGQLGVKSEFGKGTTFWFTLLAQEPPEYGV